MGLFGTKIAPPDLEDDLCRLRRRVDELESAVKITKLEGTEVYEKTLRLFQRMAKRYAIDSKENGQAIPTEPDNEISDGVDPVSAKILARRARVGVTK